MTLGLFKNINQEFGRLKEQAAPTSAPTAPTDPGSDPGIAAAPAPATTPPSQPTEVPPTSPTPTDPSAMVAPAMTPESQPDANAAAPQDGAETETPAMEQSEETADTEDSVPEGQPKINKEDPAGAVFDYAKELAEKTISPEKILAGIKYSIQSNFGNNYEAAWSIVQRLKDTENVVLIDVANRLSLFISGIIQENKNKGMNRMKISRQEIREIVKEIIANKQLQRKKNISLNEKQFERIIQNTVHRVLNEGAFFDTYRSRIDQEQSAIEQQLTSTDIRRMAIDLFEKICDKTGVDVDSDNPESPAMQFVKAELDRMVTSAQEVANKLIQVATVVRAASDGAPKNEEGQG